MLIIFLYFTLSVILQALVIFFYDFFLLKRKLSINYKDVCLGYYLILGGCCSKVELSTNPQRTKIVALSFCTSKNDALEEYCFWKSSIGNLISSKLAFDFEFVTLPVRNLFNFESGASIAVYDDLEVLLLQSNFSNLRAKY